MDKIAELRALRAEKIAELTALVEKDGGEESDSAFDALKKDIDAIDAKIRRLEEANRLKGAVAVPGFVGQPTVAQPMPLKRYGRLGAFKDITVNGVKITAAEQAYKAGKWLAATVLGDANAAQWCRENGVPIVKAATQNESANSAGGFLVPDQFMDTIIDLREQYGVIRANAQIVPMARDTIYWPRRTGGVTAYFTAEGSAPTQSAASWDNINLTAKKLAALVLMSTELAEDAMINVADWITQEIAYAFSSKEDDCGFSGDGTSTYAGMVGLINSYSGAKGLYTATGHTTADAITATDLTSMMALLPRYALPGAKFYMSQYFFALMLERLVAAGGGNTIQTLAGEVQYRYLGYPVVISQKLASTSPTGVVAVFFGDMAKAVAFGERREVSIKRSDDRYFDTDQVGIMGTERFDINVHDVSDASTAGPLVALKMG